MSGGTLFSKITGQLRTIFLVLAIGALGEVADAFDVANNLPTSLNLIVTGGIFNAILVSQIVRAKQAKNAEYQINKLITFAGLLIFIITVVLTITSASIITLVASHDWSEQQRNLAIVFGFYCMPQVFFYGLYVILGQVLASHERFVAYAWAPVANNIISVGVLGFFIYLTGGFGVFDRSVSSMNSGLVVVLAGGATFAIAAQALILIIPLWRMKFKYRPIFGVHGFGLRKIFRVSIWSFLMICIEQATALYFVHIASTAPIEASRRGLEDVISGIGGNAAYTNALLIYIIPHSLVTISIQTTLFTRISQAVAEKRKQEAVRLTISGCEYIIVIISLFGALFMALYLPVSRVLVPSASDTALLVIGQTVFTLSLMLVPIGVFQMVTRLFFAHHRMKRLFFVELIEYSLTALIVYALVQITSPRGWVLSIGLSRTIGAWIGMFIILYAIKLPSKAIYLNIFKCTLSAILSAIVGSITLYKVFGFNASTTNSWAYNLLICAVISIEVLLVYYPLIILFRVEKAHKILKLIKQKLRVSSISSRKINNV
jgi:putative peptidoglycan lipid II flippase